MSFETRNVAGRNGRGGHRALDEVTMHVPEGAFYAVLGPNGSGKSTLMRALMGLVPLEGGTTMIGGRETARWNRRELARFVGAVSQTEHMAFPLRVDAFVEMGRYPHLTAFTTMQAGDYAAIDRALEQAGVEPLRNRNMNTLSGGERQMVFIAAALAQETGMLLLDEPSSFLDYRHQAAVAALLKKACRDDGMTVVAVHHDVNTAMACSDRILALKHGRIVFNGTPEETADSRILADIYDTDFLCTPAADRPLPFVASGGAL